MLKYRWLMLSAIVTAVAISACGDDPVSPGAPEVFTADLRGTNEVPQNASTATGTATITLSADRNTLTWDIPLTGIQNISGAHIHIGAPGANGPIILGFPGPTNTRVQGDTTRATFSANVGGRAYTFDELIELMRLGVTYVNVHTDIQGQTTNQPGDLPAGEIRGQVRRS